MSSIENLKTTAEIFKDNGDFDSYNKLMNKIKKIETCSDLKCKNYNEKDECLKKEAFEDHLVNFDENLLDKAYKDVQNIGHLSESSCYNCEIIDCNHLNHVKGALQLFFLNVGIPENAIRNELFNRICKLVISLKKDVSDIECEISTEK